MIYIKILKNYEKIILLFYELIVFFEFGSVLEFILKYFSLIKQNALFNLFPDIWILLASNFNNLITNIIINIPIIPL